MKKYNSLSLRYMLSILFLLGSIATNAQFNHLDTRHKHELSALPQTEKVTHAIPPVAPFTGFTGGAIAYGNNIFGPDLFSLDIDDPTNPQLIANVHYQAASGDIAYDEPDHLWLVDLVDSYLKKIDITTGQVVDSIFMPCPLTDGTWTCLTIDRTTGLFYAIASVYAEFVSESIIYEIDPFTGVAQELFTLGPIFVISGTFDLNGILYVFEIMQSDIYAIDVINQSVNLVGNAGFIGNFAQGMGLEPLTNEIYLAAYHYNVGPELRLLDKGTGATSLLAPLPGETTAFAFPPQPCPQLDAGPDQTVVEGEVVTMQATIFNACSINWLTLGDGEFDDPTLENPTYFPGPLDAEIGIVDLCVENPDCPACDFCPFENCSFDCMTVTIGTGGNLVIICPPDVFTENNSGGCFASDVDLGFPVIEDPGGTAIIYNDAPDVFPVGTTVVTWIAEVIFPPNSVSCEQLVTVEDFEVPQVSLLDDINAGNDPGQCDAILEWDPPIVSDNCGTASLVGSHSPGDAFPVGLTAVTYTATDSHGNQGFSSFTISVLDTEDPQVTPLEDINAGNDPGQCDAILEWDPPTAADNCGIVSLESSHSPGDTFPVGLTAVTHTATDSYGNQGFSGFTVSVVDTDPPDIICPPDILVNSFDPPLELFGATPEGGVYDGPGVFDGIFYPADAGVGNHQINYLYANPLSGCNYSCGFFITVMGGADHIINIQEGWGGISSYIQPSIPSMNDVLNPIINELVLVYNFEGMFYPGQNIYTLEQWDSHSGYIANVNQSVSLPIQGEEVIDKSLFLDAGWTIMPVLSSSFFDIELLFAGTNDALTIVKDIAGQGVYWNQFGINTIGFVEPGKSYYVLMNDPSVIFFGLPLELKNQVIGQREEKPESPWNDVLATPVSHVIAFNLSEQIFEKEDIVGAFNQDGSCAGLVQLNDANSPFALNAFGYSLLSDVTDGLETGERIEYKLYRPSTDETFEMAVSYNPAMNTGNFESNGLSEVTDVKLAPSGFNSFNSAKINIYPNPNKGIFTIEGFEDHVEMMVFNSYGEEIFSSQILLPGKVNLTNQPKGIYIIELTTNKGVHYEKIIIN